MSLKRIAFAVIALLLAAAPVSAQKRHYTIMCMGDSLTQGGDTHTSYHYPLWQMLDGAGYDFEFVGPNSRTFDEGVIRNCGFGGRTTEYLAERTGELYGNNPADIVLLFCSGNHFIEEKPVPGIIDAYESIIREIESINPDVRILVGYGVHFGKLPKYSYIPDLDKEVQKMVKRLNDKSLTAVNIGRNYDWKTGAIEDKVHTTYEGAQTLAKEWFEALKPIMGEPVHSSKGYSLLHPTWTESEFQNPPHDSKMQCFFHWQSGHVDKAELTKDLESLKDAGFSGVTLFNVAEGMCDGPVKYMSPEWWDVYRYMQKECKRLGLEMGVVQGAGWGVSGAPWVTPDKAMQEVVWTEKTVDGRKKLEVQLEIPVPALGIERDMQKDPERNKRYFVDREKVRGYYRDIAVFAIPAREGEGEPYHIKDWWAKVGLQTNKMSEYKVDHSQAPASDVLKMEDIIDISGYMDKDGVLRWKAPKGKWTILRIGYQPIGVQNHPAPPEGRGLEIDKMSAEALDFFWENSVTKDLKSPDSYISKVIIDSYEAGHQNWTEGFEKEFSKQMGYDIRPYLPAITGRVLESTENTEKFLWDYRQVIGRMINTNFYGRMAEKCHENGVEFALEPYGFMGNTNEFTTAYNGDTYLGEFWSRENASNGNTITNKLASSLGHLQGHSIVGSEAFTTSDRSTFAVNPRELKTQGDFYFCQGINQFWLHSFVHDPYGVEPGLSLGYYGPLFNRHNTWWEMAKPWYKYIARCQYMLQQGMAKNDILYFMGEDAPLRPLTREQLRPEIPYGYDYDFCAMEMIDSLSVRDHRLVLPSGMSYNVLVVKDMECMRPELLEKIVALAGQGAYVYMRKPSFSPSLAYPDNGRIKVLADKLEDVSSLQSFLSAKGILPDFAIEGFTQQEKIQYNGCGIQYIHRSGETSDLYFVSNQQENCEADFDAFFNINDRIPEFWDANTGKVSLVPAYERTQDGRIKVKMHLERAGSVFVVFRRPFEEKTLEASKIMRTSSTDLTEDWTMTLADKKMSGNSFSVPVLSDLSTSDNKEWKYYSGPIVYEKTFRMEEPAPDAVYTLDLGRVEVIAKVTVNGKEVGTLWKYPYSVDVTPYLKAGENTLRVEVANLWVNALVGDSFLPEDSEWTTETLSTAPGVCLKEIPGWVLEHKPSPTGRKTFTSWKWNNMQKWALPGSGLVGPVSMICLQNQ